ncbi:MAG: hypothetical protein GY847_28485 [Proteobacteria bacterium]|nr:hypothetical protein [Pseudomonadota bacterium]
MAISAANRSRPRKTELFQQTPPKKETTIPKNQRFSALFRSDGSDTDGSDTDGSDTDGLLYQYRLNG